MLWQSSVQASTASDEGFGVATLEAMATTTSAASRTGAYPEPVGDVSEAARPRALLTRRDRR